VPRQTSVYGKLVKSTKPSPAKSSSLVVVPPPPKTLAISARSTTVSVAKKRPSNPMEKPSARDSQGKAGRAEIRREEPRRSAPRATARTPERGNQPRSHKSGKK
jgi:hypothetical protein